ncbi:MAG: SRPBCC family protein [Bacteroidales bacterium]
MKSKEEFKEMISETNVSLNERMISIVTGTLLLCSSFSGRGKLLKAISGGFLMFRGFTGYCPGYKALGHNEDAAAKDFIHINTSVTVDRPRQEVYDFWRKLENLPRFMKHLESVEELDNETSLWKARIPGGLGTVDWKSEIVNDKPNEHLSWRSVPDSQVQNTGFVDFRDTVNLGTVVHVVISYHPPAGKVGKSVGKLFNPLFEKMITDDIKNFKEYLEEH